jgi:DNA-binding NarL/FixJ family response regulator
MALHAAMEAIEDEDDENPPWWRELDCEPTPVWQRDRQIVALRRKGWSLRKIARQLRVSKSGVAGGLARISTAGPPAPEKRYHNSCTS